MLRIYRTRDHDAIKALHRLTFPADLYPDMDKCLWWIVKDGATPVAFAGVCRGYVYAESLADAIVLERCGVIEEYRGQGLQARLIKARLSMARWLGYKAAVTYTYCNPRSTANLLAAGFTKDPGLPLGTAKCIKLRITL